MASAGVWSASCERGSSSFGRARRRRLHEARSSARREILRRAQPWGCWARRIRIDTVQNRQEIGGNGLAVNSTRPIPNPVRRSPLRGNPAAKRLSETGYRAGSEDLSAPEVLKQIAGAAMVATDNGHSLHKGLVHHSTPAVVPAREHQQVRATDLKNCFLVHQRPS